VGWTLALGFEFVIIQESHQEGFDTVLEQIEILKVGSDSGESIATFQPYDCVIVIFNRGEVTLRHLCAIRSLWSIQQRLIEKRTCIVHSDIGHLQTACNMQMERKSLSTPFTTKRLWPRSKFRNTTIRAIIGAHFSVYDVLMVSNKSCILNSTPMPLHLIVKNGSLEIENEQTSTALYDVLEAKTPKFRTGSWNAHSNEAGTLTFQSLKFFTQKH
jgi:hypothetical protein